MVNKISILFRVLLVFMYLLTDSKKIMAAPNFYKLDEAINHIKQSYSEHILFSEFLNNLNLHSDEKSFLKEKAIKNDTYNQKLPKMTISKYKGINPS